MGRKRADAHHESRLVPVADLKPHPRNYKKHPADQLRHIAESIRQHGFYRNVVVARDLTILAGHGVVEAARQSGIEEVPVVQVDLSPDEPRALKILTGDNELGRFSENDDRALSEILKQIRDEDADGLVGTGYDDQNLAAFLLVTRPASEIRTIDEAAEWVGMPEYDAGGDPIRLVVTFKSEDDRKRFVEQVGLTIVKVVGKKSWSAQWPFECREDASSVKFEKK